jgi:hypothetical protein
MCTPRPEDVKRIANDFARHKLTGGLARAGRYGAIRSRTHDLARRLLTLCPPGLGRAVFSANAFLANAAIASDEKPKG